MSQGAGRVAGLSLLVLAPTEAIERYTAAIALGNSASTRDLFAALGVDFPLTEVAIKAAAQAVAVRLRVSTYA